MSDLYWITVLGNMSNISPMIAFLSCFIAIISLAFLPIALKCDEEKSYLFCKKLFKTSAIIFTISLLISIFAPSTKEAYIIYGVGSVIDYAKNSKEVQKLPDNVVKVLNKYLEEEVNNDSLK